MRKLFLILICLLVSTSCQGAAKKSGQKAGPVNLKLENVQKAVVAGGFYPGSKDALRSAVDGYLKAADVKPIEGDLMGIIVPHAGYQYSGHVAAYGFKQLEGRQYDYAVVIALAHRARINGAGTRYVKEFETPLGKIPVATDIVKKMITKYPWIEEAKDAFENEHSLEVELPFLQTVLKNFKLVPILVGTHDPDAIANIAGSLNEEFKDKKVIYIISTDLSHHHPYDKAVSMDKRTLDLLTKEKFDEFIRDVYDGKCELCGFGPVMVMLNLYKMAGGGEIKLLKYANSADTAGDKGKVVGYGALAVIGKFDLSAKEKEVLLSIAKKTVEDHVNGKKVSLPKIDDPYLMKPGAAFVTLKKRGELRGCIGHIIAREPLAESVM